MNDERHSATSQQNKRPATFRPVRFPMRPLSVYAEAVVMMP